MKTGGFAELKSFATLSTASTLDGRDTETAEKPSTDWNWQKINDESPPLLVPLLGVHSINSTPHRKKEGIEKNRGLEEGPPHLVRTKKAWSVFGAVFERVSAPSEYQMHTIGSLYLGRKFIIKLNLVVAPQSNKYFKPIAWKQRSANMTTFLQGEDH